MLDTSNTTLTRLRLVRLHKALSQAELADRAQVARTTIIRLEQGNPNVNPSTLRKLARALGVKPADLFGEYPATTEMPRSAC
jgi:transcriptional regulator with XRE-family HTH domain